MKVIIAGSRCFKDYDLLKKVCDRELDPYERHKNIYGDIEIVSGGAHGADLLGEKYANEKKYPIKRFPANWEKYGKSAGHVRNSEMGKYANALIAFWDEVSPGTKSMIKIATNNEFKLIFVEIFK